MTFYDEESEMVVQYLSRVLFSSLILIACSGPAAVAVLFQYRVSFNVVDDRGCVNKEAIYLSNLF
jgi:hypothetical protein